jgi:hypothetical protein
VYNSCGIERRGMGIRRGKGRVGGGKVCLGEEKEEE